MSGLWAALGPVVKLLFQAIIEVWLEKRHDTMEDSPGFGNERRLRERVRRVWDEDSLRRTRPGAQAAGDD